MLPRQAKDTSFSVMKCQGRREMKSWVIWQSESGELHKFLSHGFYLCETSGEIIC